MSDVTTVKLVVTEPMPTPFAGIPDAPRGGPLDPGDPVLVTNQPDPKLNGVWLVSYGSWRQAASQ